MTGLSSDLDNPVVAKHQIGESWAGGVTHNARAAGTSNVDRPMDMAMHPQLRLPAIGRLRQVRCRIARRPPGAMSWRQTDGMWRMVGHHHKMSIARPGHGRFNDAAGARMQGALVGAGDHAHSAGPHHLDLLAGFGLCG